MPAVLDKFYRLIVSANFPDFSIFDVFFHLGIAQSTVEPSVSSRQCDHSQFNRRINSPFKGFPMADLSAGLIATITGVKNYRAGWHYLLI
jgi:hypothetical protein